ISITNIKSPNSNLSTEVNSTTDGSNVTIVKGAPALSNISISSDGINSSYAKVGDLVTLRFTSSEPLRRDPVVGIGSSFLEKDRVTGNTYEYTYMVKADDTEGELGFVISNIENNAGVMGSTYR